MSPSEIELIKMILAIGWALNIIAVLIFLTIVIDNKDEIDRLSNKEPSRYKVFLILVPFFIMFKMAYNLFVWRDSDSIEEFLIRVGAREFK